MPLSSVSPRRAAVRIGVLVAVVAAVVALAVTTAGGASAATPRTTVPAGTHVTTNARGDHCYSTSPNRQMCVHIGRTRPGTLSRQRLRQQALAAPQQPPAAVHPADLTLPAQCNFDNVVSSFVAWPDRFTSCNDTPWTLTSFVTVDGVTEVTGTLDADDFQWNTYSATSLDWTHDLVISVGVGTGDLVGGTSAEVNSGCSLAGGCVVLSSVNPDTAVYDLAPGTLESNEWVEEDAGSVPVTANSVDYVDPFLGVGVFGNLTASPWGFNDYGNGLVGRCDNTVGGTTGCVDEDFTPVVSYDTTKNPLVGPVAQHIYNAQNGGLATPWGNPSNPLQRDTSQADINANRTAACGGVKVPTGDSCDEFPLASTYQGAAFQSDFSTAIVPASANNSQGGITSNFYTGNRIIDGDSFYVLAVLSTGATSW